MVRPAQGAKVIAIVSAAAGFRYHMVDRLSLSGDAFVKTVETHIAIAFQYPLANVLPSRAVATLVAGLPGLV
ncbi:hypothetical protein AU489_07005 [Lonsdalea populi]|uniref:Uncharacterized protein n=1 Tax=Lonsdalea quercina TaxID=71657 RepID=A0ACD1JG81_9GAMM|nr:hypothetical protein AU485_01905 [Lonsdalea quercina]RAT23888.1 hypothetical protein AU487_00650 [Lonsdalea populi]RAT25443.1 hypothetical protein AU489_07005 [Lonsdalea populi]RAT28501.1 hypothetical protein AU488_00555 [Lonsdalea populi]RAT39851.1 hypothetical protein AU493_01240 [Lonsdalea populi]